MLQGKTVRSAMMLLAAVLLCLPFSALTTPFASAHNGRDAKIEAAPGNVLTGKSLRDEVVTHRECEGSRGPIVPLPRNDRPRTAAPVPQAPERPLRAEDPASVHEPVAHVPPHHSAARPRTAHTPAALQVFRC